METASNNASFIVDNGLILNFDASNIQSYPGSGTTWIDLKNGYNASLVNGVGFSLDANGCLTFDGINDYVSLYDVDNDYITIGAIIKLDQAGQGIICSKQYVSGVVPYSLSCSADNPSISGFAFYDGNGWKKTGGVSVAALNWVYVVGSFDGRYLRYYENNVLKNTLDLGYQTVLPKNNANLLIGNYIDGGNRFKGKIACYHQYDRALTDLEITTNYNYFKNKYNL